MLTEKQKQAIKKYHSSPKGQEAIAKARNVYDHKRPRISLKIESTALVEWLKLKSAAKGKTVNAYIAEVLESGYKASKGKYIRSIDPSLERDKKTAFTIRIDQEVLEWLQEGAARDDKFLSGYINDLIGASYVRTLKS